MDHFVDALGDMCPLPIIKAEKKIKLAKAEDRIIILTDHSCSLSSVPYHFKSKYGYTCTVIEEGEGIWRMIIELSA